jgi:hypothetical protein
MFRQLLSRLNALISTLLGSEALTICFGAVLVTLAWLTTNHIMAAAVINAVPSTVPLATVPSIDCLMQYPRCAL